MNICEEKQASSSVERTRGRRGSREGLAEREHHREHVAVLGRVGEAAWGPESKKKVGIRREENGELATIESLPGLFLVHGCRGRRDGSGGGLGVARGGVERRRHGEEDGGSGVFFLFVCSQRIEKKGRGAAARGWGRKGRALGFSGGRKIKGGGKVMGGGEDHSLTHFS
jgi:hypothetical protein